MAVLVFRDGEDFQVRHGFALKSVEAREPDRRGLFTHALQHGRGAQRLLVARRKREVAEVRLLHENGDALHVAVRRARPDRMDAMARPVAGHADLAPCRDVATSAAGGKYPRDLLGRKFFDRLLSTAGF